MAPTWSEHPVDANFYGNASTSTTRDSPYDAVFSPVNKHKGMHVMSDIFAKKVDLTCPSNNNDDDSLSKSAATGTMRSTQKAVVERPASHPVHALRELTRDCLGANPQGGMTPPSMHLTFLRRKVLYITFVLTLLMYWVCIQVESSLDDVAATMATKQQQFEATVAAAIEQQSKPHAASFPELLDLLFTCSAADAPATMPQADGLPRLCGIVTRAAHHRCMNQLHRRQRYLRSVHHILGGPHVSDVGVTSKEVASMASVDDLLRFDLKLHLLSTQRDWLHQLHLARRQSMSTTFSNHHDHRSSSSPPAAPRPPQSKHIHMKKLLEAASWYRWLQQHAHEDNNNADDDDKPALEHLADMLSEDACLSEYVDLMGTNEVLSFYPKSQFENLVFATLERRVSRRVDKCGFDAAALYCEPPAAFRDNIHPSQRTKAADYRNVHADWNWLRDPQPAQVMAFVGSFTRHVRGAFAIPDDVHKSLYVFIQRMLFPRITMLCYNGAILTECARKDTLWRNQQAALRLQNHGGGVSLEQLGGSTRTAVVLHDEAAQIFGTTRIPVDTFFPLFSFVLLHTDLPFVHAQLHLLEQYALCNPPGDLNPTRNGEESYYVYCMHAAVEHVCSQVVGPLD
ncbi:hypothetical protein B5M09_000629 [Aphanomyces astaci]|uniref:Uncharacterized protein n=1 Tax=Aphanomyces astaci TaxID=112090 RepID=A0A3R7ZC75_APHAT|nr:hypothetical protein B5M09_000629 [Aphanomyces astaci]